jgi:prophage regulatory protein
MKTSGTPVATWHPEMVHDTPSLALADEELWRLSTVVAKTGVPRSAIYRQMATGAFPRPRRISDRAVAWLRSDVVIWMREPPVATAAETVDCDGDA